MPAIARIEPLTTARALRGPFDYRLPPPLEGVGVGSLLVVPFGRRRVLGVVVELARESEIAPERLAEPIEALAQGVPPELVRLALWIAEAYCSTPARALGLVLPPGSGKGTRPRVRERSGLVAGITAPGEATLDAPGARLGPVQRSALAALREAGGRAPAAALPGGAPGMRRLEARGLVALERRALPRRPIVEAVGARDSGPPELTVEQAAALDEIESALAARTHDGGDGDAGRGARAYLLHGVTGSGKTEVYLRAAQTALGSGRGVIVLVPEIGLTPQIVARFVARFGDTVAVLHSQLSAGERHDEWLRLRRGEARVCVGPRSAVFAPVADLGLVIVDEEHDASYKNEGDPRYDARAVAQRRAEAAAAVLVAGSATPRPESALRLPALRLTQRVDRFGLPAVEILDMSGADGALHATTVDALAAVRRAGRKAIVLLNRRGWSNFLSCRSCGRVWKCPDCDVSLVLHRAEGRIACHHCGHSQGAPQRCDACGSVSVARHGAGTERLEHDLMSALGDGGFPIFRLDSDIGGGRDRAGKLLRAFDAASAGVLLGTQMVAKGHDFPDVTLGVVLDADATLRFPDFRSEERTFALVAQLAGRAGRGPGGGRVLVQTMAPDAPAIVLAARHDTDGFLRAELARREALRYPPFAELIRIVCASPELGAADAAAGAVRESLALPGAGAGVLGPAPLFRLRGRERAQLVVKAASERVAVVAAVDAAVRQASSDRAHRGVSFSVDVDPQ